MTPPSTLEDTSYASNVGYHLNTLVVYDDGGGNGSSQPPFGGNGRGGEGDGAWEGEPSILTEPIWTFLIRGMRSRLAADPYFGHKLLVECGLDAMIIVGVNWAARKDRFVAELEFTLCQLAISLLSDFALVYLLAPSALRSAAAVGSWRWRLEALPAHVFQRAGPGVAGFSTRARVATLLLKAAQYGGVGFAMGCLGAASVQLLIWVRERTDSTFVPPATVQSIKGTGMAWSGFMASSSNVRYNVVNGMEDALYRHGARAGKLGSVALRLLNNWAGAAQWVVVADTWRLDVPWTPSKTRLSSQ